MNLLFPEPLHSGSSFVWWPEEVRVVLGRFVTPGSDEVAVLVSSPRLGPGVGLSLVAGGVPDAVAQVITVVLVA